MTNDKETNMMNVSRGGKGKHVLYRIEMLDGHYEYLGPVEAARLFDNLRDALRTEKP